VNSWFLTAISKLKYVTILNVYHYICVKYDKGKLAVKIPGV
jgi:hypothetical protein